MGMTIDEAIRRIDLHNYIHQRKEPRAVYITEALDVAIETMKKYQKIVDIVTDDYGYPSNLRKIMDIKEVLEDATN